MFYLVLELVNPWDNAAGKYTPGSPGHEIRLRRPLSLKTRSSLEISILFPFSSIYILCARKKDPYPQQLYGITSSDHAAAIIIIFRLLADQ